MKILLINPPYLSKPPKNVYFSISGYTIPHLGIGYIASYLQEAGYDVTIVECMRQGIDNKRICQLIKNDSYKMIGISIYSGNQYNSIRILNLIKKNCPDSFVFFGGYTATLSYNNLLTNCSLLDCCVLGEGEQTTLELAKCLSKQIPINNVPGIAYREGNNVVVTEQRKLFDKLDMLPFPKRIFYSKRGEATIVSSRGCLNQCSYCAINAYYKCTKGKKIRFRSAENIIDEINYMLTENPNIRAIGFYDDNFLANIPYNRERIKLLLNLIKQYKLDYIDYYITVCADDICKNSDLLRMFKEVGLKRVFVGIESFVKRQLEYYRKNATVADNLRAIEILREMEIEVSIGFVPYDPYVTIDEIMENFRIVKRENLVDMGGDIDTPYSLCSALIAVSNTDFRKELEKKGIFFRNDRGYFFINENVEYFYELKKIWIDSIDDIVSRLFYLNIAREHDIDNYKILKQLKREFMMEDINFLLDLCDFVKFEGAKERDVWENFLKKRLHRLTHIKEGFFDAEKRYEDLLNNEYYEF